MEALYVLLIFSLLLGVSFLVAFFWAQKNGQFEDTKTPAIRVLFDDIDAKRAADKRNNNPEKKMKVTGEYHGS
ncbi:MAG: hypothetical protein LDLANPLL_02007 [Turneriella sp.]|nr:hypothetical protein [Turneriella sp.]